MIAEGVYREFVRPACGGSGSETMISYEAAPGAKVVIKGSAVVKGWRPSTGWDFGMDPVAQKPVKAWELPLDPSLFPTGYNPFEVDNVIGNRVWLRYAEDNMATYFRRRGMVFVDGHPLGPVELPNHMAGPPKQSLNFFTKAMWSPLFAEFQPPVGSFWVETNGMTVHIRLANDDDPAKHTIEITTQEQVFSSRDHYQSYIRVKGITFQHAGNGLTKVVKLNLDNRSYAVFSTKPKDRVRRSRFIAKYGLTEGITRFAQGESEYMQSLEDGVRSTVNSIYDELSGTGTWGSKPSAMDRPNHVGKEQGAAKITPTRETAVTQKPVRGVVLEFATRLRQSRGRRELLND